MTSIPPQPGSYPQPGQYPPPGPVLGRRTGYGYSLLANLVWAGLNFALILILLGPPPSPEVVGSVVGSLLFAALLGAVGTWLVARTRASAWPFWQLVALALPFFLALRFVVTVVSR